MTDAPLTQRDLQSAVQNATLSVQMTEVIKDLGALNKRLDDHEKRHEDEQSARVSGRRWLVGSAIAFLAAIEVPLGYLIAHLH